MAQQTINIGTTPNDNTGDPARTAGTKINENFTELYAGLGQYNPWTPIVSGSTTAGTGTYGIQEGWYVKSGRTIHIQAYVNISAHTGTGNLLLTNFPYPFSNTANFFIRTRGVSLFNRAGATEVSGFASPGQSQLRLDNGYEAPAAIDLGTDTAFLITLDMTYLTD